MIEGGTNVDQGEIAHFDAQSRKWWDPEGQLKALHQINPQRLAYVSKAGPLAGKQILDVGCGGGLLCEALAAQGARVTGIDMSTEALTTARAHAGDRFPFLSYEHGTAEQWLEAHAGEYDIVTCMELVEHVPDPGRLVRACAGLVSPGGHVFFSTVNRTWISGLLVIGMSEYVLGIVPKGTHQYRRFVKPDELTRWAGQGGLNKTDLSGLRFLPYIGYVRLSRDTRMNYLMHFTKPASFQERN